MSRINTGTDYLCYECGLFRHPEVMQKYSCKICEGRKCLLHHTIDKNLKCEICGIDNLCNDCLAFRECCTNYLGG